MSTQKLVLDTIKQEVKDLGFNVVIDYKFSNTGTFKIMKGLKTILAFHFNFQSSWETVTFQFYPGDKKVVATCGFTHQDCIKHCHFEYKDIEKKVEEILLFITNYISKAV